MGKRAYFTVLSTNTYLKGVLALNECLKKVSSKYPLYVLLNEEISSEVEALLNKKNIQTIRRAKIDLPMDIVDRNNSREKSRWNYTFDKLNIFELTDFEKIVFLDSDIYVRKNIDELFDKPNMSAVIDKHHGPNLTSRCIELTSGVMVIVPQENQISKFQEIIKNIINERDAIGDQDILQEYDPEWKYKKELHLKNKYNIFFPYLEYYINFQEYSMDDVVVVHFIYPTKPWMVEGLNRVDEYINYINSFTESDYEETGIPEMKDALYGDNSHAKIIMEEYYELIDRI